jgi:hypothetical protein
MDSTSNQAESLKRFDWILAVLIVAAGVWHWRGRDTGTEPAKELPVIENLPPVTVSDKDVGARSKFVAPAKKESVAQKTISARRAVEQGPVQAPRQPPKGLVEFEVKENNLAIAFGDVVLGKVTADAKLDKGVTPAQKSKLWGSPEIPYSVDKGITDTAPILEAIEIFQKDTNIRFVPYNGQTDSLVFVPSNEICASYLGRIGGGQPVYLSPQCGTHEVMHELMHALGFVHEHSRPDRDKYVEVLWPNIDPKYWAQFYVVPDEQVHDYVGSVFSFDPESIMLYDSTAFAREPGTQTLKSRGTAELKPSRKAFSRTDRERLFYLYGQ